MGSPVKTLPLSMPVSEVIDFFKVNQISGAPVVNPAGFAVGMVSRTNLISDGSFDGQAAKDIMTPFVFDITPEQELIDVAKAMSEANIRRVVVTEDGKPVGVVTAIDVVKDYIRLAESEV
jgi:predicted transcriptional regulator